MGFNLGAFAGGIAEGGTDTYLKLQDQKRRDAEAARQQEQHEAWKAKQGLEEDIRRAGKETLGMAGKPVEYQGGEMGPQPEAAQTALRSDIATAPAPIYTEAQAQKDYLQRLRGLDTDKAQAYEANALALNKAKRGERYEQQTENALGFQQNVLSDLAKNGGDAAAVLDKHFIPLYNDNKLPGLSDGGTAKIVPSAVGSGKSILITDKDGKESTLPADLATLQKLTGHAQELMMQSSSPENYWKFKKHYLEERTTAATEKNAAAAESNAATQAKHLDAQVRAGLFEAQASQARGAANQANAHAAVFKNMVDLAKSNKEAGEAVKETLAKYEALTDEEKTGPKGQQVLIDGAVAAAKKTGDLTGIMNALKKPDRSTVTAEMEKAAYAVYNEAVQSNDPKRIAAAKAAYPQVFGASELDKAIAAKSKQTTPAAPAAATPAAPAAPTALPTAIPTNAVASNPYRSVSRGSTTVDQAAIQKDLAEYKSLQNSAVPLASGRKAFLEQKLRAAGVLQED